jgi:hypothetical protein
MKKIKRLPVWLRKMVRMIAQVAMAGEKGAASLCTCRKERTKYDLTAAQCF